jgi:predicted tellurium resistance membrane protein TerC
MIVAVVVAVGVMMVFAESVSRFIEEHPTMKMLALSFLILIGVMLVAEGLGQHVDKGYIYFAMAFSLSVEMVNLAVRRRQSHS